MIVLSYEVSKDLNKLKIISSNGSSLIWGWAEDELVVYAGSLEDREGLTKLKEELKTLGYKGVQKVHKSIVDKVEKHLNTKL